MKIKIAALAAALLGASLLAPVESRAQQAEYDRFQSAAAVQSVLYRGRAACDYSSALYNGHYYWSTKEFLTGSVLFNGKRYGNVLLNIDACDQQLLAKAYDGAMAVIVSRELVPEFEIDGESFVNLSLAGLDGAAPGFYRIACEQPLIYQRINKIFTSSTGDTNGPAIGYDDPYYRDDVLNYFLKDEHYYVLKEGKLKKTGRRKALKTINAAKAR